MPTVFREGPYRFYFYSHDIGEPPHVHVDRGNCSAKFWLSPVVLASNLGFSPKELRAIERLVVQHRVRLIEGWNAFFGTQSR